MPTLHKKLILALILIMLIASFFIFDLGRFFELDYLKAQREALAEFYQAHKFLSLAAFFVLYILVTALNFPGAAILTLAAGAFFGVWTGLVLVSFASTIGATGAMMMTRYFLGEAAQRKYADRLAKVNAGVERDGAFYLLSLRLVPVFPFFLVNMLMGLTKMPVLQYFWVSQVGMLPGTLAYVYAGTALSEVTSLSGIVSPSMIFALVLLGLLPWFGKLVMAILKKRKAYATYAGKKPKSFDYNLIVIGAGAGGLVSAYIAAASQAKVALIERDKMGGDCLNTGCVPSKALIRSAKFMAEIKAHQKYGIKNAEADFDFKTVMARVHEKIKMIEPHDSVERYEKLGVECIQGNAELIDPWHVKINGKTLSTRSIILALGAAPYVPEIEGQKYIQTYNSDTIWSLTKLPKKMIVMGGGPIGCELGLAFARLGVDITLIERNEQILKREEPEAAELAHKTMTEQGVTIITSATVQSFTKDKTVIYQDQVTGAEHVIDADAVLFALGRRARHDTAGMDKLGIQFNDNGTIAHDAFLRTNFPNIYVCGDAAGPFQFTHAAAHQAWYASVNALFSPFKKFAANYRVMPRATYIDPEIASVGITEAEAIAQNIAYEVTKYGIDDLDRAIVDNADKGFVKIITKKGSDKILGVTIVGAQAAELLSEFTLAMTHGLGLNKILSTIHIYPTMAEANKYVAGNWRRAHLSVKVLAWAKKFHNKMRGAEAVQDNKKKG